MYDTKETLTPHGDFFLTSNNSNETKAEDKREQKEKLNEDYSFANYANISGGLLR